MLIVGIHGSELTAEEVSWLQHPALAGVILFSRNFVSREQVVQLIGAIRAACPHPLLICVDQEGGRVQRFRSGFSALPALASLREHADAEERARRHGWLMASEMLAIGIDLSFAPVVDLGRGNLAIGDRALHDDPAAVSRLALAYLDGMRAAGMAATLKHFPGHGSVLEDTHFDSAVDPRALAELQETDLQPFAAGIAAGAEAIMMAHVNYPAVDADAAGYSSRWIRDILRAEMGFAGVVISDDIGMAAAESAGGVARRLQAHFAAGCDLVLVCAPSLVGEALAALPTDARFDASAIERLRARRQPQWSALQASDEYAAAIAALGLANVVEGAVV